jgi:hypothetical protein
MKNSDLLNPVKYGVIAFQLLSGKVLKMLCPMCMAVLLGANVWLVQEHWLYALALLGQLAIYVMVLGMSNGFKLPGLSRIVSIAHTFVVVNAAIASGWMHFFKGKTYTTWAPVRK